MALEVDYIDEFGNHFNGEILPSQATDPRIDFIQAALNRAKRRAPATVAALAVATIGIATTAANTPRPDQGAQNPVVVETGNSTNSTSNSILPELRQGK